MRLTFLLMALITCGTSSAQTVIPLYEGPIPNSIPGPDQETSEKGADSILRISHVRTPTLQIFLPRKPNGTSVIIFPGGGYSIVAGSHEGTDVARRLTALGFAAFVVKYRLPDDKIMVDKSIGPLQDAERAIQVVRENAERMGLKKNRIGIMGFSAGGHLASTLGTHYDHAYIPNPSGTSLRPDFMVLVYPVISFSDSIGHLGSRDNLLGKNPTDSAIRAFSNELQVTDDTPPTYLVAAKDDDVVKVANTLDFAEALRQHHVPVEVYLYEHGGHGFGLHNRTSDVDWLSLVAEWMRHRH